MDGCMYEWLDGWMYAQVADINVKAEGPVGNGKVCRYVGRLYMKKDARDDDDSPSFIITYIHTYIRVR